MSKIMNNGMLESVNNLTSVFVGHLHFKKLHLRNWNSSFMHDHTQEQGTSFLLIIFIRKNQLRKENMGQLNFKKPFGFHSFRETFTATCFCTMKCTRTILRNKNMGQSLFKNYSKFQNFWWNILLWYDQTQGHEFGYFYEMSVNKNYFKKEKFAAAPV